MIEFKNLIHKKLNTLIIIGLISYDGQEKPKSFTIEGKYIFGEDGFYNDLFMRD